jgi:hypothetical protein
MAGHELDDEGEAENNEEDAGSVDQRDHSLVAAALRTERHHLDEPAGHGREKGGGVIEACDLPEVDVSDRSGPCEKHREAEQRHDPQADMVEDRRIARVRGVHGYQLPKWLAKIKFDISSAGVAASIAATDGTPDVTLTAPLPPLRHIPSQSRLSTNTTVGLVDGEWRQTQFVTNPIEFAQTLFPRDVKLSRAGGPISQLLDGLGAGRILRLDVVKDAQMVLHLPRPLQALPPV